MKYLLPTLVALALAITATSCKTNIDPTSLVVKAHRDGLFEVTFDDGRDTLRR